MFKLLRKHPAILTIAVLTALLLAWGFWPKPLKVETVDVKRAPFTITVEEEGRTRVIDRYIIAAPVDGVTCRVGLKVGDEVEQGQTLLAITPMASQVLDARSRAEAQARMAAAQSALSAAKEQASAASATAQRARAEQVRVTPLLEKGLVPREVYDRLITDAQTTRAAKRSADFNVDVARYELEAARTALQHSNGMSSTSSAERVPVRSPIDGRILKIHHKCEGPLSTGEHLLEVGDPTALEVEVDVLSADAVKIKPGMKVWFDRWGGEQTLEGVVRIVEPVGFTRISALGVEEQRVLVIIDFTSPHEVWQRLGDGYRVEAGFVLWHEEGVLQVPASSVFRHEGGWAVFVAADGYASLRPVKPGQRTGLKVQVLEGLDESERVIHYPSEDIEHGSRIRPYR